MNPKAATIVDVARAAGTSKSTVSKVLRGEAYVAAETRARVEAAIRLLGYRPNAAARSLVQQRAHTIGVLVGDLRNPFFAEIAHGVAVAAAAEGYGVLLGDLSTGTGSGGDLVDMALSGRVDGLVLAKWPPAGERVVQLVAERMPVILVSCRPIGFASDFVVTDEALGASMAVRHLLSLGHSRIGYIGLPTNDSSALERLEGYRTTLVEAGLPFDSEVVTRGVVPPDDPDFGSAEGFRAATSLLSGTRRPTAILAGNDYLALGAMEAIEEQGLAVPRDVSLVGFDDIRFARLPRIGLTTVAQPTGLMGREAVQLLVDRLRANQVEQRANHGLWHVPVSRVFAPELIVRQSTAHAAAVAA
jgi:DNA-binding LacI/PurR family transcriptional regulator